VFDSETFEKCFPLLAGFRFKSKIPDFERGKRKILTTGARRKCPWGEYMGYFEE